MYLVIKLNIEQLSNFDLLEALKIQETILQESSSRDGLSTKICDRDFIGGMTDQPTLPLAKNITCKL